MREDFLHYIWKLQLLTHKNLICSDGETLVVLHQGQPNFDAGPDFFNAKIKIGNQLWAGNVEIHVKASDWYVHHHEVDSNYDSVILHIVWENDAQIFRKDNSVIPTLVLKDFVSAKVLQNYKQLFAKPKNWINCEKDISDTDEFLLNNWLERLYIERLEQKATLILELLEDSKNDWESVLFILLAKNFGLTVNGEAFLKLAKYLEYSVVIKLRRNQKELEALFFGQANLLDSEIDNSFSLELTSIYNYQKVKFKLMSNSNKLQFFRLRPSNFPTIRLAQLAALYHKHQNLFSKIIVCKDAKSAYRIFSVTLSEYWRTHYSFKAPSNNKRNKNLTKSFIDLIIINTIIPLQFVYQKHKGNLDSEKIMQFAQQIKSEKNGVVSKFRALKIRSENAFKTQALLQLKNDYCSKNKCVQCAIGNALLRQKSPFN